MSVDMDTELILDAAAFAADKHAGQLRKELNEPYINHPIRCAKLAASFGYDARFVAALLLHDVVEDTSTKLDDLVTAGFPSYTVTLVEALTKTWGAEVTDDFTLSDYKRKYYRRICETDGGAEAKVIDRIDNLRDMIRTCHQSPNANRWARRYLAKTLQEFPPVVQTLHIAGATFAERYPGQTHSSRELALADMFDKTVADVSATLAR